MAYGSPRRPDRKSLNQFRCTHRKGERSAFSLCESPRRKCAQRIHDSGRAGIVADGKGRRDDDGSEMVISEITPKSICPITRPGLRSLPWNRSLVLIHALLKLKYICQSFCSHTQPQV